MIARRLGTLALLAAQTACMQLDYNGELNATRQDDTAEFDAGMGLRIDATPTFGLTSDSSLTQSFFVDQPSSGLRLELEEPVQLLGTVTGYDASPTTGLVSVPGSTVRVEGVLEAWVPDTAMHRTTSFGSDGAFRLDLVPDLEYVVAWVPTNPAELPFLVSTRVDLSTDTTRAIYLDYGLPVFGQVVGESGPLRDVPVRAVDVVSGVAGPTVTTSDEGRYSLRLYPGEYTLVVGEGLQTGLPTQRIPLLVPEEAGVEQDVAYGYSDSTTLVDGDVLDTSGRPLADVVVRLSSVSLEGTPYGQLVAQTDTASNGRFSVRAQPGTYRVEYLPPADSQLNPLALPDLVTVGDGQTALEDAVLTRRPTLSGQIVGVDSLPVADALVRVTELEFDGYVFETYTGADGSFALEVTDAALRCTVIPPAGNPSAITSWETSAAELDAQDTLTLSAGVELGGQIVYGTTPAAFTSLDLRDLYGNLYTSLVTDADGRFGFRLAQ